MYNIFARRFRFQRINQIELANLRVVEVVNSNIAVEEQAIGSFEYCLSIPYNSLNDRILMRAIKSIKTIQSRENVIKLLERLSWWLQSQSLGNRLKNDTRNLAETVTPGLLKTKNEIQGIKNVLIHIMMQAFPGHHQYIDQNNMRFYLLYYKQGSYQKINIPDFILKDKRYLWEELNAKLRFELEYEHDLRRDYFSKILLIIAEHVRRYTQSPYKKWFVGELPLRFNIEFLCKLYNDVVDALNTGNEPGARILLKDKIVKKLQTFNPAKRMPDSLRVDFEHLDSTQKSREECFCEVSTVYTDYVQKLETEVERERKENHNLSRDRDNLEAQFFFQTANLLVRSESTNLNHNQSFGSLLPPSAINLEPDKEESLALVKFLACIMETQSCDSLVSNESIYDKGYGNVYKGVYNNQLQVAIKEISHAYAYECKNEVTYLLKLKSEHILKLKGFIIKSAERHLLSPTYYIITEYVANGSLYEFLKTDPGKGLPLVPQLKLAMGILKGLTYLHQENVIHADLKSPNVLINKNIEPILADFGSAVPKGTITTVRGTPGWMALELLKILSDPFADCLFTEAIDMYAFGIILHEILHPNYAYKTNKVEILQNPYPVIQSETRDQLKSLMTSCWSVYQSQRPSAVSASKLIQDATQAQHANIISVSTRRVN